MKALLLAAGLGTRLRPLTATTPKPLLPIHQKPLLEYHLDHLQRHGITHILINTHYLSEQIESFLVNYRKKNPSLSVSTFFEKQLLGSAGTLRATQEFFDAEKDFFVVYADNFTDISYTELLATHRAYAGVATIAVYNEQHPEQKGVIEHDQSRVRRFVEKPRPGESSSNLANAGIYVFNTAIFKHLKELSESPLDFGYHVFPYLLAHNKAPYVYLMDETLLDIGTFVNYEQAPTLLKFMNLG